MKNLDLIICERCEQRHYFCYDCPRKSKRKINLIIEYENKEKTDDTE